MSRFKRAVIEEENKRNLRIKGENSHPCYNNEGFGSSLLALFDRHFQGISESDLRNKIRDILNDSFKLTEEKSNNEGLLTIVNLFVLCFNTRWCRGGKGAKLAFYQSIKFLFEVFPIPVIKILPLIPEFGYWKDLLLLLQHIKDFPVVGVDYTPLESAVWDLYAQQLINDYTKLIQSNNKNNNNNNSTKSNIKSNLELGISSAGKYAPRENKQFDNTLHAVSQICSRIFTESNINSFPSLSLNNNNSNNNDNTNNDDDNTESKIETNDIKIAEDGINYGNNKEEEDDEDDDDDMVILSHEDIGLVENVKTQEPTTSISIDNNNNNNNNNNNTSIKPMNPKKKYREIIATLNRALDVVEVKMCSNNFSSINMAAVPSRCMSKNQTAFANEKLNNEGPELKQGNRHPDNQDRIKCRQNLLKVLSSKGPGVKGSQLYPHEYVDQVIGNSKLKLSLTNKLVINSQWQSMRESIEEMIKKRKENIVGNELLSDILSDTDLNSTTTKTTNTNSTNEMSNIGLGNIIPLSDVSGSMAGTPMSVAIGLGILCSELAHESFRDLVMTFSGSASWENLSNCNNFIEKVTQLKRAHWEGSTNFYNALKQISDIVLTNKLRQDEIPNLLVISDMQFDAARGVQSYGYYYNRSKYQPYASDNWNTVYENIEKLYHDLGMKICGTPYTPPIIIFWNVRADTVGFPVTSDQKGVMMLSGYSPALMKFILSGEFEKEVIEEVPTKVNDDSSDDNEDNNEDNNNNNKEDTVIITKKVKVAVSPIEVLKKVLNEDKFDCIRQILYDPSVSCYLSLPENNLLPGNGSVSDPLLKPPKKQEFKAGVRQTVPKVTSRGRGRGRGGSGINVGGRGRGGRRGRRQTDNF